MGWGVVFPRLWKIPKFIFDGGIFPGSSIKRSIVWAYSHPISIPLANFPVPGWWLTWVSILVKIWKIMKIMISKPPWLQRKVFQPRVPSRSGSQEALDEIVAHNIICRVGGCSLGRQEHINVECYPSSAAASDTPSSGSLTAAPAVASGLRFLTLLAVGKGLLLLYSNWWCA